VRVASFSTLASTFILIACSPSSSGTTGETNTESDSASSETQGSTASEESEGSSDEGSGDGDGDGDGDGVDYSEAGPHPVGNSATAITEGPEGRELPVEFWYPASADAAEAAQMGQAIGDFLSDPDEAATFAPLVDAAPETCTTRTTHSAYEPEVADIDGPLPLIVFSHCHACTRFSTFTLAERLASHGFVVAAVGHTNNRLFDELAGTGASVGGEFLLTRGQDMKALLDAILDPGSDLLPEPLTGLIDADAIGAFGHSFGAATTGLLLQDDDRVKAGAAIAAPIASPLIPGVDTAAVDKPMLFFLATEDNSITELGNTILRNNFNDLPAPAWKIELEDAGHWSFTDICNITDDFKPGCGEDERMTAPGDTFTYLDIEVARDITADALAAFFAYQLRGESDALEQLESSHPSGAATLEQHD
jgi:predicted dienelactone hydrolase